MEEDPQNKTNEHEISNSDEQTLKKSRHRKKQLYNSILQQMEFYFSDSNLTKDRFLSKLIEHNPYVDLSVFLKFNKIRKLTTNVEDIKKALKKSQIIEFSEDRSSIRRKEAIKEKSNVDECTIYVERLKSDATHEWLNSVFSEFGTVVYISIPKYKHNSAIKGFAFIEFEKETEAEKALSYFESIGCKMPSHVEPDQLCSIATFEGNTEENIKTEVVDKEEESKGKKRKLSEVDEQDSAGEKEKKLKTENGEASESEDTENKKKKKLKKDNKKKNYIKELGLQVLSKKEWKKMRNRYLDLQRKKMKEFKKHLHKAKYSQANYDEKKKPEEEKEPEKTLPKYEFTQGLIVKIKLTEPNIVFKKLKNELKSLSNDIMYVDIPFPGSEDVYVRFKDSESAKAFCNQEFAGKKAVITGDEEKAYWLKIQKDREQKINKARKKQRGRDKLLKKAKHTKFDE